jgi:TolA-binding protein
MTVAENDRKNGHLLDALTQMDDVATGFGKLAVAHDAAARVATWEKTPEAKGELVALKNDRAARQLYLQGRAAERAGDPKKALAALDKLAKAYPQSRFTARSEKLLASLRTRK